MTHTLIEQFETLICRDPGNRGLIAGESRDCRLCAGHLHQAAVDLADGARHVGVVTGFFVPHGTPPAAETDGPPGTMLLADALHALGVEVTVLTDERCFPAVAAAAEAAGWDPAQVLAYPHVSPSWRREFFTSGPGRTVTHLIAVERVGPSHTPESLKRQPRSVPDAPDHPDFCPGGALRDTLEKFLASVPAESHDRCHNMRGDVIDEATADMHRLFEELSQFRPEAKTIGIGDGGNEIGMGAIPWEELWRRLEGEQAPRLPCRVPTDWTVIAGTSNWGAYALAAAVLILRNRIDVLRDWDRDRHQHILEFMVEHGPAVDGVTGRRQPTVDGLPFITYIQPWEGIRRLLGFDG